MASDAVRNRESNLVSNVGFNTANIIQVRLDCNPVYEQVERFLYGATPSMVRDENNKPRRVYLDTGFKKCNDLGIQVILNKITSLLNSQTVQGNLKENRYELLVSEFRESFMDVVVMNCYEYEIKDEDLNFLIDYVMDCIEIFLTRTIGDGERNSYTQTLKSIESNTVRDKDKKFNIYPNS